MMASNGQVRLGELSEITPGPSGSLLERLSDGPDGVPVVSPPDITDYHTVDTRRLRRVPTGEAKKLSRFILRQGDILTVRQGALGRLAFIDEVEQHTWLYNSSCLRIRPYPELIHPVYLMRSLSHPSVQRALLSRARPGTVPFLNSAMLEDLPITVPPMIHQQEIIEVLADIDTQIKTHRETANRLETLRPAIYEEMLEQGRRECAD